jgi:hypothetical protein
MMQSRRFLMAGAGGGATAFGVLYALGRHWGATRNESQRVLSGDEIVSNPSGVTTHAITIKVPPEEVWPWIVQMGYHRGGWYTYPWVDRYIWRIHNPSANEVRPDLQDVRLGSIIPDGEPGTAWYVVERFEPHRLLVLHSTSHIPAAIRKRYPNVSVDWTWTFALEPTPEGHTRLLLRVRPRCTPWWFTALYHLLIVPSDFFMARSMLRGIKTRAEGTALAQDPSRTVFDSTIGGEVDVQATAHH